MNQKVSLQQIIPLLLVLLLIGAIGLLSQRVISPPAIETVFDLSRSRTVTTNDQLFDSEQAADISAARWQAMGRFYEEQGMLTRDDFDYAQAADVSAARWQAMAKFYADQGLLTRDNFDYEKAADVSAARWQAMGKFYEYQVLGINYAMDPVDLKLFNSAETAPTTVAAK